VGLAASLVSEGEPVASTHTPEVIRQLTAFAPDVICLTDQADCDIDLPRVPFPVAPRSREPGARARDRHRAARRLRVHLRFHRHAAPVPQDLGPAHRLRA